VFGSGEEGNLKVCWYRSRRLLNRCVAKVLVAKSPGWRDGAAAGIEPPGSERRQLVVHPRLRTDRWPCRLVIFSEGLR
jgi:hypothetical protein